MKRWPLHPQPTSYETLETYVRRLAECYGVSYPCFCLHALGIPITDSEARRFKEPSPELLQRLSEGVGIPVDRLAKMTWQHIWTKLLEEVNQYAATPEGKEVLERISTPWFSQNL